MRSPVAATRCDRLLVCRITVRADSLGGGLGWLSKLSDNCRLGQFGKGDRIILIGNITHSYKDFHRTPTSRGTQPHDQTAGVFIQAQMVSQIISAVQDNRPLMQPIPRPLEIIWILAWSSLGGFVGWRVPGGMRFYFTAGGIIVIIYGVCFVSFMVGYWIPLVPSGLGFALTAIILKKPGLSHHPSITTIF
ncbi:MAG: CHASE2 domain-containing protein [Limnospira sp. PMC 1291.21]|uniref:CHASE2 domain-containing protein n=1 Tax=unclassified Limnospira TaxID=2642885 RepID=UPI0028E0C38B|nr:MULTISPECIES: CHASE2 domain-containing protein [unclassified Limnospira]MDT9180111.1 CHASE2 domain-containing protein [Limnospira sp. PMC 1238.20]MDT9195388.1 CHASE2 domain-containing protein [Limnospira sp. PMC 1245.20]MDT9205617.1 CHASE2 domain-containing protein [Limnospira sp. PMC 1243.20]MDT9210777.1 CHASE2 domain-containing protein [Limnospira sp. PMC 1252.20]MDT9215858.1 CHASE2 domain-containing protein [Limnospira sp. PMC 1256.20]